MGTNIPGSSHSMSFAAFTQDTENWSELHVFPTWWNWLIFLCESQRWTWQKHDEIRYRWFTSRWTTIFDWFAMNFFSSFYGPFWQNRHVVAFFHSRVKLKIRPNKIKDFVFYIPLKKATSSQGWRNRTQHTPICYGSEALFVPRTYFIH